jgi:hypothetical protein
MQNNSNRNNNFIGRFKFHWLIHLFHSSNIAYLVLHFPSCMILCFDADFAEIPWSYYSSSRPFTAKAKAESFPTSAICQPCSKPYCTLHHLSTRWQGKKARRPLVAQLGMATQNEHVPCSACIILSWNQLIGRFCTNPFLHMQTNHRSLSSPTNPTVYEVIQTFSYIECTSSSASCRASRSFPPNRSHLQRRGSLDLEVLGWLLCSNRIEAIEKLPELRNRAVDRGRYQRRVLKCKSIVGTPSDVTRLRGNQPSQMKSPQTTNSPFPLCLSKTCFLIGPCTISSSSYLSDEGDLQV